MHREAGRQLIVRTIWPYEVGVAAAQLFPSSAENNERVAFVSWCCMTFSKSAKNVASPGASSQLSDAERVATNLDGLVRGTEGLFRSFAEEVADYYMDEKVEVVSENCCGTAAVGLSNDSM